MSQSAPIVTSYMRLALVLREALAEPDHDAIVGDAKGLILAARDLAAGSVFQSAIIEHLAGVLEPYSLFPVLFEGALALQSPNRYLRAVPL